MRGESQRPLCHFELPESDYLTGNRRNPSLPGPFGKVGPLDPRIRVIELISICVKVVNENDKRGLTLNLRQTGSKYKKILHSQPHLQRLRVSMGKQQCGRRCTGCLPLYDKARYNQKYEKIRNRFRIHPGRSRDKGTNKERRKTTNDGRNF